MIAATDTGVVPMRVSKAVWVQDGEANAHFMVLDEQDRDRHLLIQVCQAQAFDLAASLQGWQLGLYWSKTLLLPLAWAFMLRVGTR